MLRTSRLWMKPKSLHEMFRKLKLQGAHPDVLWSIDAQKAQHNGEEMIRLETLFHQRSTNQMGAIGGAPQSFSFWLKPVNSTGRIEPHSLRQVSCTIQPKAPTRTVKSQLQRMFADAGISDDFEVSGEGTEVNLETVLRDADAKQTEHVQVAGTLYIRGDKAVTNLRKFGVLVVVEEDGHSYLATLPESSDAATTGGIAGPSGEVDSATQEFLRERNLKHFDLRMAGSYSSVERFVSCFERLARLYDMHRGRAVRSGVCIVISLKGNANFVADDGSIVLAIAQMPTWEEYILSLPADVWSRCVQAHKDWRLEPAPKLVDQRRKLLRVADMFHVFGVVMENRIGGQQAWQDHLINRFLKEEVAIRKAVKKYNLTSDLLKRKGFVHFREDLRSIIDPSKQIGYRVGGDGKLFINQAIMTTPQILKVLKENLKQMERLTREYEVHIVQLEHISRQLPLDFSVDSDWRLVEESNIVNCLGKFVQTMKANQQQLAVFLSQLLATQTASSPAAARKRLVWIISNKFETMPSGVVFIPWDVDFESIKKMMLSR